MPDWRCTAYTPGVHIGVTGRALYWKRRGRAAPHPPHGALVRLMGHDLYGDLCCWRDHGFMPGKWRRGVSGRWRLNMVKGPTFPLVQVEREKRQKPSITIFRIPLPEHETLSRTVPASWAGDRTVLVGLLADVGLRESALDYAFDATMPQ